MQETSIELKNAVTAMLLRGTGLLSHVAPSASAGLAFRAATTPRRRKSLPASADVRWRTASGLRVYGWGQEGPLVLCLHGWESSGLQFSGLAGYLKTRGYRVWALDAPAHGESPGRRASPIDLLHALRELHAIANEPVSVVGHSVGATMVMLAMREQLAFNRRILLSGPTAFPQVFDYLKRALGLSPDCYDEFVRRVEAYIGRGLDSVDLTLAPPTGPALLIHDSADREVPLQYAVELARIWPQAKLSVTDGLGHRRILHSEAVWDQIAHYLAEG